MSKTINTHVYALRGTTDSGASYGAQVGSVPYEARLQSLQTRQSGEPGVRTSRSIVVKTADAEGVAHDVVVSVSCFLPNSLPSTALDAPFAELAAWVGEATFLTSVKNLSVE
mgnify:CR=1 FL=1